MLPLVDTHIHLDAPELDGGGPGVLAAARQRGVVSFVVPGVRVSGWPSLVRLAGQWPGVYAAPGLHPAYAGQWNEAAAGQLRALTRESGMVAIGEIGLDGAAGPDRKCQETVLRDQLAIALDASLPVLLHARQATGRLLEVLKELQVGKRVGGIWHGFSGSLQVAQRLADMGFLIGVGPILLRDNARKLPEAVRALPLECLVLETDLPDMADHPGTLVDVAERVAELRREALEMVAATTTDNARKLLGLNRE